MYIYICIYMYMYRYDFFFILGNPASRRRFTAEVQRHRQKKDSARGLAPLDVP